MPAPAPNQQLAIVRRHARDQRQGQEHFAPHRHLRACNPSRPNGRSQAGGK